MGGSPIDGSVKRKRDFAERVRIEQISKVFDFGSLKGRPSDPHDDALVIDMQVEGFTVRRTLLDTGSSVNIITRKAFEALGLDQGRLTPSTSPLVGISGHPVLLLGETQLEVEIGNTTSKWRTITDFLVIDTPIAYNVIIGRPLISGSRGAISLYYLAWMIPTERGMAVALGSQSVARHTYMTSLEIVPQENVLVEEVKERGEPVDAIEAVTLEKGKVVQVSAELRENSKKTVIAALEGNKDVFAWASADIIGVSREVMEHTLDIDPEYTPVKQKKRNQGAERQQFIKSEVEKLLEFGRIKEVHYPQWISNVVLVKKANGKWRMCVDFSDLNKACPKDFYPLPCIDMLVDSTAGYEVYSFLDAKEGFHQIPLAEKDMEKTSFITPEGTYCYQVMPFGLKNAGATYQRLVNKMFKELIGKNVEIYVDDMIVKSKKAEEHARDLEVVFRILREYNLKLNPEKCTFGINSGKFLGFMISKRGIEANPDKIKAIIDLQPPKNVREVQVLNGKINALGRFISYSAKRCMPFYKSLKGVKDFVWTDECQTSFEDLKKFLSSPPLLSQPVKGENLYLYISVGEECIGMVLIREEEEGKIQYPVYYVSKVLRGAESRYPKMEKLAFGVYIAAQKLRHYFLSYTIVVRTDTPLRKILSRPEASGRLTEWSIKLTEFDVRFEPRPSKKAQVLSDFLIEVPPEEEIEPVLNTWEIFVDGSANKSQSGIGIFCKSPDGLVFRHAATLGFDSSNNAAEYEAILLGLRLVRLIRADKAIIKSDSGLATNQIRNSWETKHARMKKYHEMVKRTIEECELMGCKVEIVQIPREENMEADHLAKLASDPTNLNLCPCDIQVIPCASIDSKEVFALDRGNEWYWPIFEYLYEGKLPEDKSQHPKIVRKSSRYTVVDGNLFRRSYSQPWLKAVGIEEGAKILEEIHEGSCGAHEGWNVLARKARLLGYYWPQMNNDAAEFVKKCAACQAHSPVLKSPASGLEGIKVAWPFATWGIDIVGQFPMSTNQKQYVIVAVDHFTKWVEAEAVSSITAQQIVKFVKNSIVYRFGVPNTIITDNGKQFDSVLFRHFCEREGIKLRFSSVFHPQTNGMTERTNRTIMEGIKRRLTHLEKLTNWVEELYHVLWSYRTTPKTATGETPFSLTYGTEAFIPVEIKVPSTRVLHYTEEWNELNLRDNLDDLEEKREMALARIEAYKARTKRIYDKSVRPRQFFKGDFVLRSTAASSSRQGKGKLGIKWEGPFRIIECVGTHTYRLQHLDGTEVPRTWNAISLRKYYF
ncbi:Pro-Pol polyprotein [Euphorbia peplus]|nr:Pro-Pol polyprotein [Euphorbia peplus]